MFKYARLLFIIVFWMINCTSTPKPVNGQLEISFELIPSTDESVVPSYQTVVWLEDTEGNLLHTLMVSEYLSYGGYNDSLLCEKWNRKVDWGNVSEELFDAVTQATPPRETNVLPVDCKMLGLLPGEYVYCVETHILEHYTIFAKGKILLDKEPQTSEAKIEFIPKAYKGIQTLVNVRAEYLL